METPDYVHILKLDKVAMTSKTLPEFLQAVQARLQIAKNLGVEANFSYFVQQAWLAFGDGK